MCFPAALLPAVRVWKPHKQSPSPCCGKGAAAWGQERDRLLVRRQNRGNKAEFRSGDIHPFRSQRGRLRHVRQASHTAAENPDPSRPCPSWSWPRQPRVHPRTASESPTGLPRASPGHLLPAALLTGSSTFLGNPHHRSGNDHPYCSHLQDDTEEELEKVLKRVWQSPA